MDIGMFLTLLESFPHIYDLKNKHFKNARMKENSWKEIANAMDLPVAECQRVWKNLRDRYTREKRQKPPGGIGVSQSSWEFMKSMSFYERCIVKRRSISTFKPLKKESPYDRSSSPCLEWSSVVSPEEYEVPSEETQSYKEDTLSYEVETMLQEEGRQDDEEVSGQVKLLTSVNETTSGSTTCAPKTSKEDDKIMEVVKLVKSVVSSIQVGDRSVNATFCKYVLETLNSKSEQEAKELRKKIVLLIEDV